MTVLMGIALALALSAAFMGAPNFVPIAFGWLAVVFYLLAEWFERLNERDRPFKG